MTQFEILSLVISGLAAIFSCIALGLAWKANNINSKAIITNVKIAQRQGVVDLSKAWDGVNRIPNDDTDPIVPNIVKAANALSETAAAWNHDIVDKGIIIQMYWHSYRDIYDAMYHNDRLITTLGRTYKSMVSSDVERAYQEMRTYNLNSVTQTRML